jgi:hypothetical protein
MARPGSIATVSRRNAPCWCVLGTSSRPTSGTRSARPKKKYEDTGRRDRIAFAATDVEDVRQQAKNAKFRESIVPRTGDTQFLRSRRVGVELKFAKM